jgi:hypothetical protein
MAVNYATIFSPVIDQALVATLTSALMQADAADVKYEGGATIKIATITTPGLGNYTRATGYPTGALSVDWNSYTFEKDRAIRMNIDKFDVDETNFVDTVANAVKVMRENDTDPEIDAYRYSKVFSTVAATALAATPAPMAHYTPEAKTILGKLQDDMTAVQDTVGETAPLVCYMSRQAYGILAKTDDLSRTLNALETDINGVKTKVKGLDDMPIIPVPSARMRTAYTYNDGSSTYGFAAAATAGKINWIIAPRGALKAVVKGDEVKVIEPGVNQTFSGWSILFRLYHTLLVLEAKIPSMRISFQPGTSALSVTVEASSATGGCTKATATAGDGNKLGYKLSAATIGGTSLKDVHIDELVLDNDKYTSGADIAATADQYLTVVQYNATSGLVVASYEKKLGASDIKS